MDKKTNLPLFLAYPQLVERAETRKDTASQPTSVATFDGVAWRVYFDLQAQSDASYDAAGLIATHVVDVSL